MYVAGGWFQFPTFPSYWYHPVLKWRLINNATDFLTLTGSWSPTAGLADMRRTEAEAEVVIQNDLNRTLAQMGAITPATTVPTNNPVNYRSAAWQAVIDRGWQITPLAAAVDPIGTPAPVVEGRAPGVTPPPGSNQGATVQARSEDKNAGPQVTGTQPTPGPSPRGQQPTPEQQHAADQLSAGIPPAQPQDQPKPGEQEQPKSGEQRPGQPGEHEQPKPGEHGQQQHNEHGQHGSPRPGGARR